MFSFSLSSYVNTAPCKGANNVVVAAATELTAL